jgi:hypothetical protein
LIGETGFNSTTSSLAFNEHAELYGITGSNQFIRIDIGSGEGTLIGSPSASGIIALAMRVDSVVLSVRPNLTADIPTEFALSQNYPNPFNPETEIDYAIPVQSQVSLRVYNMIGQDVGTLVNELQSPGYYSVRWNGKDDNGRPVASGLYLLRIEASGEDGRNTVMTRKMILLK